MIEKIKKETIEACFVCGGLPFIGTMFGKFLVRCQSCDAHGHLCDDIKEVVEDWNNRTKKNKLSNRSMQFYAHQHTGKDLFKQNPFFANFGEPGTGKTAQAIVAADELEIRRMLVVCPSSLVLNWSDEIKMWSTRWRIVLLVGTVKQKLKLIAEGLKRAADGEAVAMITNYESVQFKVSEVERKKAKAERRAMRNENEVLKALTGRWGVVIADELHRVKNGKSMTAKGLKLLSRTALRRWGMTGTPMTNTPLDVWSQIDFLRPGYLQTSFYAFRARYANVYNGAGFPKITGHCHQEELKALVDKISYRVIKSECLDLPPKIKKVIPIQMTPATEKIYRQMADEMIAQIGNETVLAQTALVQMIRLQQITSGYIGLEDKTNEHVGTDKIDALKDLLEDIGHEHVIIMSRFAADMPRIRDALAASYEIVEISGAIDREARNVALKRFQDVHKKPCILIATLQAAGVGLTLTRASQIVYYSRDFNYVNAVQSQDRIDRIGQTAEKIVYYDLVCRGTIDEYVNKVFTKKKVLADKLTGDDIRRMTMGELF